MADIEEQIEGKKTLEHVEPDTGDETEELKRRRLARLRRKRSRR
jgi:hypothetical protein